MPWVLQDGRRFPWRLEAAELAIAIAREVQAITAEGTYLPDDLERSAYETALLATADLPDEVAEIVLELSQRKDLSPEIRQRAENARRKAKAEAQARLKDPALARLRRSYPTLSRSEGPLQEQWPDGPRSRVAERFQEACLAGQNLLPLIIRKPDVALEVLLAACIEEPRRLDPFGSDSLVDHYGVEDWRGGYPPMYFQGPFLGFLRESPEHGLSFVLRLVNFATGRWVDGEKVHAVRWFGQRQPTNENLGIHVLVGGSDRLWLGDSRVLRWHLDWPLNSNVISCALMALEKWLYGEMDASRDISRWVDRILAESESLAFAGLLLDVGKRQPSLFTTLLRDLLSCSELYFWDYQIVAERANMNPGLIAWGGESGELAKLAREWLTAPHRARLLLHIAMWLFQNEEMRSFFAELRAWWSQRLDPEGRPNNLRLLIERMNPANYRIKEDMDGTVRMALEWPEDLRDRTEKDAELAGQQMHFLTFPFRCRQILDGKTELAAGDLDSFWLELTGVADLTPDDHEDDPTFASQQKDAVCGGAAVLICRHRAWLHADPARERWCLAQIQDAVDSPLPRTVLDVPDSVGEHHWEVFVGEAGVALLAEDGSNEMARRLVAAGIMAYHHSATQQTVRSAFKSRDLGISFEQIYNLALFWAAIRYALARSERLEIDVERWRNRERRLLQAFVKNRLPNVSRELGRLNLWGMRVLDRMHMKRYSADGLGVPVVQTAPWQLARETPGMDVSALTAAFAWIDLLDSALPADRELLLAAAQTLLKIIMQGLPRVDEGNDTEIERPQYEFDHWVLGQVARAIAVADGPEDRRFLWQPILDMGKPGHGWIQYFFWEWFTEGIRAAQSPESFVSRWREMIEYALQHPLWDSGGVGWYKLHEMVGEMLGFNFGLSAVADNQRYEITIGGMRDVFAIAAARWFHVGDIANGFAIFVVRPGAANLLQSGVQWLHEACQKFDSYYDWRPQDIEEHLVTVLSACWERHATDVATNSDLRGAFLGLANLLSARGCHAALVLRDRVLASLPGR